MTFQLGRLGLALSFAAATSSCLSFTFYGKQISYARVFGQRNFGECADGFVSGAKGYHVKGVAVDRRPGKGHIYVVDAGNNRVLGFRQYGEPPSRVFGQPDLNGSAANGDCNLGQFAMPRSTTLCLTSFPTHTNVAEQWMYFTIDVDANGNLYIPDAYNNRVLVYKDPFSSDTSEGRGDSVADRVIGQAHFNVNGPNRGRGPIAMDAQSLNLRSIYQDYISTCGVTVDSGGNTWVADTHNHRVLRFPPNSSTANLVIGQKTFASAQFTTEPVGAPWNRTCYPTIARVNPATGELYVMDEYPNRFTDRIMVFKPPFTNGMYARTVIKPLQSLAGDYVNGYTFTHGSALQFNSYKTDEFVDPRVRTYRYRDGVLWVNDDSRSLLLDGAGRILMAISAPNVTSLGGKYQDYATAGLDPFADYNLNTPGGSLGFDGQNIYVSDAGFHRVARYHLPYRVGSEWMPPTNGGMFPGTLRNGIGPLNIGGDRLGAITFGNQLIVRSTKRYMVWEDYLGKTQGSPADLFVGQPNGSTYENNNHIMGRSNHAIDRWSRLWATGEHNKLMCYKLPLSQGSLPLRELADLYWADSPSDPVDYECQIALAVDPFRDHLWVYDQRHHRLLRAIIPASNTGKLLVDKVIGQANKVDGATNHGMDHPDAASFGDVNDLTFDRLGNLFVVDNTYELHENGRVIAFLKEDLDSMTGMFPSIQAKRIYVSSSFTEPVSNRQLQSNPGPVSPVSVAFNSRNEMVLGHDGYTWDGDVTHRLERQLFLYRTPLSKTTPDAVIQLPLGAPGELTFDKRDYLIVDDHTWQKVWVINLDRDVAWLKPFP